MPPHIPRKRLRSASPDVKPQNKRKPTLYDDLDASTASNSAQATSAFFTNSSDSDISSLSSLSDDDFEDVPVAKRVSVNDQGAGNDESDDDAEFEDVVAPEMPTDDLPNVTQDLELTLVRDDRVSLTNPFGEKRGPTKRERLVRNATHRLHVLCLLWHNAVRNSWLCDPELQAIMLSHLPPRMWDEVDRWKEKSGLVRPKPGKSPVKSNGKRKRRSDTKARDWAADAERLEEGVPDLSNGDPLFRLGQTILAWWKQRYRTTTPGLRKWGYMALERLDRLTKAYASEEKHSPKFGERLENIDDLRQCAARCQGSRDVGAYLFTALLRALGLESRLVTNLQCLGYSWTKMEDAAAEQPDSDLRARAADLTPKKQAKTKQRSRELPKQNKPVKPARKQGVNDAQLEVEYTDSDDESVVDMQVTPVKSKKQPHSHIDADLPYANYWTEVLSPVTGNFLSIEPIVKGIVATNRELVESLEPRGAKADNARQIIAYVVAYSSDGTAKDVTVRYLKQRVFPGRTKGARYPIEKIPIYNKHGKIHKHKHHDWFKSAMSGYRRGDKKRPITDIDETEETTDLQAAKPEKKPVLEGEETLQYYKQSKEFALERHLKREEALRIGAKAVKKFQNKGKGNIGEEDVYLRSDVLNVKSAETWHKQGRAPLDGEEPLKRVPYRAATTNRRRELLEVEAATGQKVLQGLYSYDQTDWIIPDPIKDGVIPKNEYGNIDLFAEHMCPRGAVHVPFKGTVRVCKKLGVDYAEAVVGFEFGNRMAVPVIQGVVIAEENHDIVMEQLQQDEAERLRKEDEKRRKAALAQWRKFIMGMRIVQRIRLEYGEIDDKTSVFGHGTKTAPAGAPDASHAPISNGDEDMAGGFLPEGYEEEDGEEGDGGQQSTSHFFPVVDENEAAEEGDLVLEHNG
ncbi:Rad4 family protein [Cordyceps militaris CM01]|uniref:Rad4 family protein n=1 Tax=Cordyceps militaris (strain CM01) TaxID=983644 RepID=G3JM64_CORMM|nr:Rad4 family protein [Cordyceps militaris CM01]EGX90788.1 Rad4 family protein [Cordyceps militaris CM01]